jgi:hypothetical protein
LPRETLNGMTAVQVLNAFSFHHCDVLFGEEVLVAVVFSEHPQKVHILS